jgi:hypothetical protein
MAEIIPLITINPTPTPIIKVRKGEMSPIIPEIFASKSVVICDVQVKNIYSFFSQGWKSFGEIDWITLSIINRPRTIPIMAAIRGQKSVKTPLI